MSDTKSVSFKHFSVHKPQEQTSAIIRPTKHKYIQYNVRRAAQGRSLWSINLFPLHNYHSSSHSSSLIQQGRGTGYCRAKESTGRRMREAVLSVGGSANIFLLCFYISDADVPLSSFDRRTKA